MSPRRRASASKPLRSARPRPGGLIWRPCVRLLQLLLRAEHVGVAALLLAAVDRAGVEPGVALAADHLVAVVLTGEHCERRLDDAATQTEHEVQRGFLLDVVVAQGAPILKLLP